MGEVESIKRWSQTPVSFEHPAAEDERRRDEADRRTAGEDVAEQPAPGDPLEVGSLTGLERRVLELRHGISGADALPVAEVARLLDLSRDEVRQLETDGIAKLQRQRA